MTKVFITIPWFLPAFRAGGPIQSVANLVREFHEGITYYIFCGDTDLNGGALDNITTNEWVRYNEHTVVWYSGPEKISDNIVKQVEAVKPDVLFIIGMFSWHFNIVPLLFCKAPRKILSARGMLHPGALSQKKWKKKGYLWLFRLLEYHYKVDFHATGQEEENFIRQYFGKAATIFTAGNFSNTLPVLPVAEKEPGHLRLISIALVSPMKNILLVLQALEHSTAQIEYDIFGPIKDAAYWQECLEQVKRLPAHISVTFHKEIEPRQVAEVLLPAHVFILPSKSENFGHAFYEALSAGRPVITSQHTPWNRLKESQAGMNVSIENNNGIAQAIDFFAGMDTATLSRWQQGATRYAAAAIDANKIRKEYERMFLT